MVIFNSFFALAVTTSDLLRFSISFFNSSNSFFKDLAVALCISTKRIDSSISLKTHRYKIRATMLPIVEKKKIKPW